MYYNHELVQDLMAGKHKADVIYIHNLSNLFFYKSVKTGVIAPLDEYINFEGGFYRLQWKTKKK